MLADSTADVVEAARVLRHEALNELDVGVARSLLARALPTLFLPTQYSDSVHCRYGIYRLTYVSGSERKFSA